MKRTAPAIASLTAGILTTSCIHVPLQENEFYETVWTAEDVPLGPYEINSLTLEFFDDNGLSLCADYGEGPERTYKVYGTYGIYGQSATFQGLEMYLKGHFVTFHEAYLQSDGLYLIWRIDNSAHLFTTMMH